MTESEVTRLLAQARSEAETAGRGQRLRALRLVCLVELLYATGLRVSELVGLKTGAVEKERDLLVVRGKGGRERMVPISPRARNALQLWLKLRAGRASLQSDERIFPSHGRAGHLSRQHFALELKALARRAGLDPELVHPHVLRHALPRISSIPVPISSRCSRCSGMPISRQLRSIPMSAASGCAISSKPITRLPGMTASIRRVDSDVRAGHFPKP